MNNPWPKASPQVEHHREKSLQPLMVQRFRQEVDPPKAFLSGHHQITSSSSREPAMGQYIGDWENNWDRLARERGLRSGNSPGNESSPRWDSREGHNGYGNASDNGDGGSRSGFGGGKYRGSCDSYEANIFQGGGSRQGGDSHEGRVSSLQAEGSHQGDVTAQKYSGALKRQSKSV